MVLLGVEVLCGEQLISSACEQLGAARVLCNRDRHVRTVPAAAAAAAAGGSGVWW